MHAVKRRVAAAIRAWVGCSVQTHNCFEIQLLLVNCKDGAYLKRRWLRECRKKMTISVGGGEHTHSMRVVLCMVILATAALPLTLSVMLTIAAVLLHLASAEGSILPANCLALAAAVQCCAACEYAGAARRGGAEAAACFSMALPGEYARVYAAWYAGPRHVEWSTPAVLLPFIALAAAYLRAFHLFLCSVEHTVSAIVLYILCPAFMAFVYE
eukprot:1338039-Rhodomonas_salina.1